MTIVTLGRLEYDPPIAGLPMSTIEFKSETTGQMTLVETRFVADVRPMSATYTSIHLVHGQILVVHGAESDVRAKLDVREPS